MVRHRHNPPTTTALLPPRRQLTISAAQTGVTGQRVRFDRLLRQLCKVGAGMDYSPALTNNYALSANCVPGASLSGRFFAEV